MLRDIRMHNNELSITSMLNYLLPTKLLNYVTPIVNKKNEIDTIKIKTESANGAAVSITYFWRFIYVVDIPQN